MEASAKRTAAILVVTLATGVLAACAGSSATKLDVMPAIDLPASGPNDDTLPLATLCKANETSVFSGDVQDDFGLTISICLDSQATDGSQVISVRSEGEGGGTVVSCETHLCDGIIEFEHYRRYRFTQLTLSWFHDGSQQILSESFNAEDSSAPPVHSVLHNWSTTDARVQGLTPDTYPVLPSTKPLSLLRLESVMGDGDQ